LRAGQRRKPVEEGRRAERPTKRLDYGITGITDYGITVTLA
jgi:hypothetical protein